MGCDLNRLQCAWCSAFGEWLEPEQRQAILSSGIDWMALIQFIQISNLNRMQKGC